MRWLDRPDESSDNRFAALVARSYRVIKVMTGAGVSALTPVAFKVGCVLTTACSKAKAVEEQAFPLLYPAVGEHAIFGQPERKSSHYLDHSESIY